MSDYLCGLATGGGVRTRAMFKDIDETLLRVTRPIMLEGIANFVSRADLMDRGLSFALEPMTSRKTERVLQAEFERVRRYFWCVARSPRHRRPATAHHAPRQSAKNGRLRSLEHSLRAR
jgi:hypothetical protein